MIEEALIGLLCRLVHELVGLLDSCTLPGHGVADCPKLTLVFKCTLRVSPQQWPTPGLLMSEPLFMFPYHCQMHAFKPGISARCSSSDNNPVSTLAVLFSERNGNCR